MRSLGVALTIALSLAACGTGQPAVGTDAAGPAAVRPDTEPERLAAGVVRSVSGRSQARVLGDAGKPYRASGRSHTVIEITRPAEDFRTTVELDGDFEPEAFSTDENELFLIEHLDATRYRVRMMRIGSGRVLPVDRLTKFAPASMRGTGRVQVYAPEGNYLFTLYTRQPPNTAHRSLDSYEDHGRVHAFIHVLNLKKGWAHCVDLPHPFGMTDEPADQIAVSSDGKTVFVSDGQRLATMDVAQLAVMSVTNDAGLGDVLDVDLVHPSDQPFVTTH